MGKLMNVLAAFRLQILALTAPRAPARIPRGGAWQTSATLLQGRSDLAFGWCTARHSTTEHAEITNFDPVEVVQPETGVPSRDDGFGTTDRAELLSDDEPEVGDNARDNAIDVPEPYSATTRSKSRKVKQNNCGYCFRAESQQQVYSLVSDLHVNKFVLFFNNSVIQEQENTQARRGRGRPTGRARGFNAGILLDS